LQKRENKEAIRAMRQVK
jgi:hypothetical protein